MLSNANASTFVNYDDFPPAANQNMTFKVTISHWTNKKALMQKCGYNEKNNLTPA